MNTELKKQITDRIKALRGKSGLTQEQAAEAVGLAYGSYVQMENGANLPSIDVLMKIAETFKVSTDLILYGCRQPIQDNTAADRYSDFIKLMDKDKLQTVRGYIDDLIYIVEKGNEG